MKVWYRSTNYGRTWERIEVQPRSPLAGMTMIVEPGEIFDDGTGNLYRFEWSDE